MASVGAIRLALAIAIAIATRYRLSFHRENGASASSIAARRAASVRSMREVWLSTSSDAAWPAEAHAPKEPARAVDTGGPALRGS